MATGKHGAGETLPQISPITEHKNFRKRPVCPWISECIILLPAVPGPSAILHQRKNGVSRLPSAGRATSSRMVIP